MGRPVTRATARTAAKLGGGRQATRIATARTKGITSKQQTRSRAAAPRGRAGVRDVAATKGARRGGSGSG